MGIDVKILVYRWVNGVGSCFLERIRRFFDWFGEILTIFRIFVVKFFVELGREIFDLDSGFGINGRRESRMGKSFWEVELGYLFFFFRLLKSYGIRRGFDYFRLVVSSLS